MKERIKKVIKLTIGFAIVAIVMKYLCLISFDIVMATFFYFVGVFAYALCED